jgi:V/A-type H+-transporting ATPase subunit C
MIKITFHNIPDDTRYSFAVAKIRALESRMLDTALITRLLKANGTDEMLKILMDTEYNFILNQVQDIPFESVIDKELQRIYMLIKSMDPNPEWTDLWHWRYDAHNMKVILKLGFSHEHDIEQYIPMGIYNPEKLFLDLKQADYSLLPLPFKEAIEKIHLRDDEEKVKNAREIDFMMDKALYTYLMQEAGRSKNDFMISLVSIQIDLINLKNFLRMKGYKAPDMLFKQSFIPGGFITEDYFSPQADKTPDDMIFNTIESTPYKDLKPSLDSKNLAMLEAQMDNFVIAYIRQTRQRAFGVEPLIGYMIAKEMELKNLRLIYVCKANTLEEELIRERLRETYV